MEKMIRQSGSPCCAGEVSHAVYARQNAAPSTTQSARRVLTRPLDAARCWLTRRGLASSVRRSCD